MPGTVVVSNIYLWGSEDPDQARLKRCYYIHAPFGKIQKLNHFPSLNRTTGHTRYQSLSGFRFPSSQTGPYTPPMPTFSTLHQPPPSEGQSQADDGIVGYEALVYG